MTELKDKIKAQAVLSFLGTVLLTFAITWYNGVNYLDLLQNIWSFLTLHRSDVPDGSTETLGTVLVIVLTVNLFALVVAIVANALVTWVKGDSKSYSEEQLDRMLSRGPVFVFLIIGAEEIIARFIPLFLLTKLFSGDFAFYCLFLFGNSFWSVIHIFNYKDEKERSVIRVLPQFVIGLFFGYLFVRYGFWVTLFVHYMFDIMLFTTRKKQLNGVINWLIMVYDILMLLIVWIVISWQNISLTALGQWLTNHENIQPIPGFGFLQYALVLLLIDSLFSIIGNLLMYDREEVLESHLDLRIVVLGYFFIVAFAFVLNWLLSYIVHDVAVRIGVIVILYSFLTRTTSGSSLARLFFATVPTLFFIIASFSVIGLFESFGLMIVFMITGYVTVLLRYAGQQRGLA